GLQARAQCTTSPFSAGLPDPGRVRCPMQPHPSPRGLRDQLKSVSITTWLQDRVDRLSGTCLKDPPFALKRRSNAWTLLRSSLLRCFAVASSIRRLSTVSRSRGGALPSCLPPPAASFGQREILATLIPTVNSVVVARAAVTIRRCLMML